VSSNVLVNQFVFRNILRIQGTEDHVLSFHRPPVDHFNDVDEVLFRFKSAHKLSVIWCTEIDNIYKNFLFKQYTGMLFLFNKSMLFMFKLFILVLSPEMKTKSIRNII